MTQPKTVTMAHPGGAKIVGKYDGEHNGRGRMHLGLSGDYDFYLFDGGKHDAGQFVREDMQWWSVPVDDLERIRGTYASMGNWRRAQRSAAVARDRLEHHEETRAERKAKPSRRRRRKKKAPK